MADHAVIISNQDVTLAATTTALNTALAAEIVAVSPQPLQVINSSLAIAVGPLYAQSVMLKFQG